jgi:hypothetical protein
LMSRLGATAPAEILRLRVRFWDTEARANLGALAKASDRAVWQLVQDAHFNPPAALEGVAGVRVEELVELDREILLLLYTEARRTGHASHARLEDALERSNVRREAVSRYLDHGTWSDEINKLPLAVHGILHLARSRRSDVPPAEKERLRTLATRCDPAGGYVRKALAHWPPA